ncbi:hypothetical protein [Methylobacterium planeticum]|uniref:Uncharacterized protein n=1 Tax=Methylobacterium planeticum TaxID=2615211 RepID=A0A6N6MLB8_9HYPH|nr:hypothetical protein [Methylobacterium planeticum]KAB1069946.1 hypothetical protein F6X51_24215 [Methylobacterium planeticum]
MQAFSEQLSCYVRSSQLAEMVVIRMIRVKATDDGTYTVYRGNFVLVSGLTRHQADLFSQQLSAKKDDK